MAVTKVTNKTILILGGYGSAGRPIARLLLQETKDTKLIIAGRSLEKAKAFVDQLDDERATASQVDASSPEDLRGAFGGIDLVVVASSTTKYTDLIMVAALEAKIDYFDINVNDKARALSIESLIPKIESSDQCFVMEGGYHPGIPGALVRYAGSACPELQSANVYTFMNLKWSEQDVTPATRDEFFGELLEMDSQLYQDGEWKPQGWDVYRDYDFGEVYQKQQCIPMYMEELRDLPQDIPTLKETGMYIAGFNKVTNMLVVPIAMLGAYLFPKWGRTPMAKLFHWSLCRFEKPPFGAIMTLEGTGKDDQKIFIRLEHQDAYEFTAIPTVACLLQLLDGTARKTGLHRQAHVVEPERFLGDMKRLGLEVSITTTDSDEDNTPE